MKEVIHLEAEPFPLDLKLEETALLVIDMQKYFIISNNHKFSIKDGHILLESYKE